MVKLDKRTGNIVKSDNAFVISTWEAAPERYVDPVNSIDEGGNGSVVEQLEKMKVSELIQYAEENGIDLGGATKKADMLAAIGAGLTPPDADAEE